jgi:Leucine-rich repeat (LRR) protein
MNRIAALTQVLGLSLAVVVSGCTARVTPRAEKATAGKNPRQARAIAEIEALGGKVTVDEKSPDKPVIGVSLRHIEVTDAGLECLKELPLLQLLDLDHTPVTDVGLKCLKGLTQLQLLDLEHTKMTDNGLEHLKGLTKLQSLNLEFTKVSDAGMNGLQKALPNCTIEH